MSKDIQRKEKPTRWLDSLRNRRHAIPPILDNLLWLFCAKDYGAICGAVPQCHLCGFVAVCNYPRNHMHSEGAIQKSDDAIAFVNKQAAANDQRQAPQSASSETTEPDD